MNKLDSVNWGVVKISSIFNVKRGNAKDISKKVENGKIALLSAKDNNNGYNFSVLKNEKETSYSDCITINNNGSVAYAYYHQYEFIATSDVTILTTKENKNISKEAKLFIVTILNRLKSKYSYGYKMSNDRIKQQKIVIPLDEKGDPNWTFMEQYIKSKYEHQTNRLIDFLGGGYKYICAEMQALDKKNWKYFFIGGEEGIFKIRSTNSGIDKNKLNTTEGIIPYITRTGLNNGVNLYITDNQNEIYKIDKGNVITIGLDTQTIFYQRNKFYTGQNIQVLNHSLLNEDIAHFLITLIKIQLKKFSWGGNGATLTRLNRTKIMLPINSNGVLDWEYMQNFIKHRKKQLNERIINFLQSSILNF